MPQECTCSESPCGCAQQPVPQDSPAFIYSIGRIGWRFPSRSVEKEFAQVIGRADNVGQTDSQAFHAVLLERQNRYLLRQLCWVMLIEGIETYLLSPKDIGDLPLFAEAVRPVPTPMDVDVVVGVRGKIAPPGLCNGLSLPIVSVDQIYAFDRSGLFASLPRPDGTNEQLFLETSSEVLDRIMQIADNAGSMDEHRAINYLAVRYPQIYHRTVQAHENNFSLTAVDAKTSRLSGARRIVDVILTYTNRSTESLDRYFVRVDVTEQFPFLVSKLSPYFDR